MTFQRLLWRHTKFPNILLQNDGQEQWYSSLNFVYKFACQYAFIRPTSYVRTFVCSCIITLTSFLLKDAQQFCLADLFNLNYCRWRTIVSKRRPFKNDFLCFWNINTVKFPDVLMIILQGIRTTRRTNAEHIWGESSAYLHMILIDDIGRR